MLKLRNVVLSEIFWSYDTSPRYEQLRQVTIVKCSGALCFVKLRAFIKVYLAAGGKPHSHTNELLTGR